MSNDDIAYRRGYAGGWYDMMAKAADLAFAMGHADVDEKIRAIVRPEIGSGWSTDLSKAPTEPHDYFLVRPQGHHSVTGKKFLPTMVQRIDGQLYSTDNELEPLYFGEREPHDSEFRRTLEWKPLPPDWL
ncbi:MULTISPECIES: hypothetical protein [unclassified Bradyrhizobium]|uniref:hypothetical protein n=1 Tax=unclassified Bradyrhizobium TaxID=2631580 RepID=UPI00291661E5|nr:MULTISPECIES: hypothetical protein [unclassified Bradyrhizobium]